MWVHHAFAKTLSTKVILGDVSYKEVPYVRGWRTPPRPCGTPLRWLVKRLSDSDIQKVLGGNALRVLRQVWKA